MHAFRGEQPYKTKQIKHHLQINVRSWTIYNIQVRIVFMNQSLHKFCMIHYEISTILIGEKIQRTLPIFACFAIRLFFLNKC